MSFLFIRLDLDVLLDSFLVGRRDGQMVAGTAQLCHPVRLR